MEARVRERETEGKVEFVEKKKMRVGLTLFLEKEGSCILPNNKNFRPENRDLPDNKCGYDFLTSPSNSQVKSPVLLS